MQRKQPYPITDLAGGLNVAKDPIYLVDKEFPNLINTRYFQDLLRKDPSWRVFSSALPLDGALMFIDSFTMYDGIIHYIFATTSWIYEYNPTADTFTARNAVELTGTEDDAFCSATTVDASGDIYFITNGVDQIHYWRGTGNFSLLANRYAKRMNIFQNRLCLGHTIEGGFACPKRFRWSVLGTPLDLTGAGASFYDLVDTSDWITDLELLRNKLFCLKEESIWEIIYIGGTSIFLPIIRVEGIGTRAPNATRSLGESLFIYGNKNIHLYDGLSVTDIGDQVVPLLFDTETKIANAAAISRSVSIYKEENDEVWLSIPTEGERSNLLLKWDRKNRSWSRKEANVTALGKYAVVISLTWNDLTDVWSDLDWVWMERPLATAAPTTLIGDFDGNLWEDDRITRDNSYMCIETKDWRFAEAQRCVEFRVDAMGGEFQLSYSTDAGVTWSQPRLATVSETEYQTVVLPLNITTETLRAKIESWAEDLTIRWIEPWYIPRQRSLSHITAV